MMCILTIVRYGFPELLLPESVSHRILLRITHFPTTRTQGWISLLSSWCNLIAKCIKSSSSSRH